MAADGSVIIDTSLNADGMNAGTDKISEKLSDSFKSIGDTLNKVLIVGVADLVTNIFQSVTGAFSSIVQMGSQVDGLGRSFQIINQEIQGAFAPLIALAIPYMQQVADLMLVVGNRAAMLVAALMGQKTVWQMVKTSAEDASKAIGVMNNNVAGFDKLNTLQNPQMVEMKQVTVDPNVAKKTWEEFINWFGTNIIAPIWDWINKLPLTKWFIQAWSDIQTAWAPVGKWFYDNVGKPVSDKFQELLGVIGDCWKKLWPVVQEVWENILAYLGKVFVNIWNTVVPIMQNILIMFTGILIGVMDIFEGIIKFFTGVFTGDWKLAWDGITQIIKGAWNVVYSTIKGIANSIIDIINGMVKASVLGINAVIKAMDALSFTMPDWLGGQSLSLNIPTIGKVPQIPHLAAGAVIPPNSRFAAILGDQKSGTNIEAPENLLRQIMSEELSKSNQNVNVSFGGSMAELVRVLKPHIDKENVRVGNSLIKNVPGYIKA